MSHLCAIGFGVHRQLDVVSGLFVVRAGVDHHGLAGGDEAVHSGGADADALLAAAHLEAVKFAAVEEPAEDVFDLLAYDAGAVVDHRYAVARLLGGGRAIRLEVFDDDGDIRQNAGFFAGIKGIIDGFLDRGQERFAGIIEAEQMAVLGEELADGDILLLRRHGLGGFAPDGFDATGGGHLGG